MSAASLLRRAFWPCLTAAACVFALGLAVDTLRAVIPVWSPLPWFDEWATVNLLDLWQSGDMSAGEVLFAQHNEHRILVPRLVFFADDLLFRGGGYLSLAAIFTVQALHTGLFAAALARSRPVRPGRWAVAAVVMALMFSLRQAENFSSGFQLQFVAVFAGATLSFMLFALAVRRDRAGGGVWMPLSASLGAVLLTTFTMANGLAAGYVLALLAAAARMRPRVVLVCAAWAVVLTVLYLHGYAVVEHHSRPSDSLRQPGVLLAYVATYLGSVVATGHTGTAAGFGCLGIAGAACAALRTVRAGRNAGPAALAMLGVMLFVAATAAITGSGRLAFGVEQALSSRYATGSVAFWAAQLTYWWVASPGRLGPSPARAGPLVRAAVVAVAVVLAVAIAREQGSAKPQLAVQSFAQNESADALMLGLDDPAATMRAAWTDEDVQRLVPRLKADGLSIFGTADAAAIGRPLAERESIDRACAGEVVAAAEPRLGAGGVRVAGRAPPGPGRRLIRRVLLTGADGNVDGLASGAVPGAARDAWRGYAVAPLGASLTAYGLLDGGRLCRIGAATVTAPGQASQPEAAP
ncbi:hypothetical protein D3273_20880 [Lichenibacterium minor]|uniref:Glycosyltransferase RgtA/B/C/D-like domain-containing protein n=1 Tax=Lichenibacterium minor TaxID=2316528 RepID=A0A4Q2U4Z1_9HYPH|nr:hypothetical protein [Lichenibacterium minor]RYC30071.1 hypothetical protein D3273_20880 [Lichenibacterium minor]